MRQWPCEDVKLSVNLTPTRSHHINLSSTCGRVNLSPAPSAIFASWNMKDLEKQRLCVKLCLKLARTFIDSFQMFKQNVEWGRAKEESWGMQKQTWLLHHDNAPAHSSLLVREFLAKHETTVILQPLYSQDLVPADFILFPSLKSRWKMVSYGMLWRVALARTEVSEERSASFIRVTRIGELGTTLSVTSNGISSQRASGAS
jgi:hypothetical protein